MSEDHIKPEARVALVTGANRGLGRAIAFKLKSVGFSVLANHHHRLEEDDATQKATVIPIVCWNVADFDACGEQIALIENNYGPIDVLVNNAGITRDASLHKMSELQWSEVLQVNLGSVFNLCRHVIPGMRSRGFGRIINISSINGQKGQFGQCNYAAAKAGILGFTRSLALENARKGVTVNAIAPGYCDTDMVNQLPEPVLERIVEQIPIGRLGTPNEVAQAVAYLASDEAAFITGATLSINGGQYMI